ncbi:MAG: glycosyltransferase family 4 protein [Anaerolineae bacterium]
MRIGIVTGEYPPMQGGIGAYSAIFAHALVDQGHTVAVYTGQGAAANRADDSIPVTFRVQRWSPAAVWAIRQWVRDHQLEVINLQFQTAAFGMSPYIHFLPLLLRPIPVVTTFHDLRFPYLFPKAGALRPAIVRLLARTSAGVIVTNHEDDQQLSALPHRALIPIGSNIEADVPAGFDPQAVRARAGIAANAFLIGYFGFINRSKGLETLLEGAARLIQRGIPVRVVLIGGTAGSSDPTNAAYMSEIDTLIERLSLGEVVLRTGFLNDVEVAEWLRTIDAAALPFRDGASFRRGSLMAAIQYGCAIVTTQPSVPIPEFTDSEMPPMLFHQPDAIDEFADRCQQLYESPALREALGKAAVGLKSRFEWSTIARAAADFFARTVPEQTP